MKDQVANKQLGNLAGELSQFITVDAFLARDSDSIDNYELIHGSTILCFIEAMEKTLLLANWICKWEARCCENHFPSTRSIRYDGNRLAAIPIRSLLSIGVFLTDLRIQK